MADSSEVASSHPSEMLDSGAPEPSGPYADIEKRLLIAWPLAETEPKFLEEPIVDGLELGIPALWRTTGQVELRLLDFAVASGNIELVQQCMDAGGQLLYTDDEHDTALHVACFMGNLDVFLFLMDNGAQSIIEATNSQGLRPLHYAAICGNTLIVQRLINLGADVYAMDSDNCTPFSYTFSTDSNIDCRNLLLTAALSQDGQELDPAAVAAALDPSIRQMFDDLDGINADELIEMAQMAFTEDPELAELEAEIMAQMGTVTQDHEDGSLPSIDQLTVSSQGPKSEVAALPEL